MLTSDVRRPSHIKEAGSTERNGIVIVGGAVVEIDQSGRTFAKAGTVQYLSGLSEHFGIVHFFAPVVIKDRLNYESQLGSMVVFHPLSYVDMAGLQRLRALLREAIQIFLIGCRTEAALEFFPFAGGLIGSCLLRASTRRYVLYFGTDPYVSFSSITHFADLWYQLRRRITSWATSKFADFVLVRDPRQLQRLCKYKSECAHLSAPISAVMRPASIHLGRCQGQEITLLYVGMFSRRKGIADLITMLHLLNSQGNRLYRLLLVGAPEMLGSDRYTFLELEALCREYDVEHCVEFRGYVDDMEELRKIYEVADIFVLASYREGFPRVVEEALLYGVPVVAYEIASLLEVLCDGLHAMLVPLGDTAAFAAAVLKVVNDSELRTSLAIHGRELMCARFPVAVVQQHARLLGWSDVAVDTHAVGAGASAAVSGHS